MSRVLSALSTLAIAFLLQTGLAVAVLPVVEESDEDREPSATEEVGAGNEASMADEVGAEISLPAAEAVGDDKTLLIYRSQGFSRFELEGDEVVAHIVGGVEFEYMGYRLAADELYFNNSTRVASATGNITISGEGFSARSAEITMDSETGRLALEGEIDGHLQRQGFSFSAQAIDVRFAEGDAEFDIARADITISGAVTASVPEYGVFTTDEITYAGYTRQFASPGPFHVVLQGAEVAGAFGDLDAPPEQVSLTGSSFSGRISEARGLEEVVVIDPQLNAGQYYLAGTRLRLRPDTTTTDQRWRISIEGNPVTGTLTEQGRRYGVQSEEIDLLIDSEGAAVPEPRRLRAAGRRQCRAACWRDFTGA